MQLESAPETVLRLLRHLDEGDTRSALHEAAGLRRAPRAKLRKAFSDLLRRRGYFTSTPRELAASLDEIRDVGEGFDLFDLAMQLERACPGLLPIPCKEKRHGRTA